MDGVKLHENSASTTTAGSLKFMDLPGHLVQTNTASYNLFFISGPKEPTNMTSFMQQVLLQMASLAPEVSTAPNGDSTLSLRIVHRLSVNMRCNIVCAWAARWRALTMRCTRSHTAPLS